MDITVEEIQSIPVNVKEKLNHQAYNDVLDRLSPSSDNKYYMYCYRQWSALVPEDNY